MQTCIADVTHDGTNVVLRVGWGTAFGNQYYGVAVSCGYTAGGAGLIPVVTGQDADGVYVAFFRRGDGQFDDPERFSVTATG